MDYDEIDDWPIEPEDTDWRIFWACFAVGALLVAAVLGWRWLEPPALRPSFTYPVAQQVIEEPIDLMQLRALAERGCGEIHVYAQKDGGLHVVGSCNPGQPGFGRN